MGKVVCTAEQDLHNCRPKGTCRIESHVSNGTKGKNLTRDHQADDEACPTRGCATIDSGSHDDQEEEEGANSLHSNGDNPATTGSVKGQCGAKVCCAKARALRRSRPTKGKGNDQRADDSTKELGNPVDSCLAPAYASGDSQGESHCRVNVTTRDVANGVDHRSDGKCECQGDHTEISHCKCNRGFGTIEKKNRRCNRACANPGQKGSSEQFSDKLLSECWCPIHSSIVCSVEQTSSFRVGKVRHR